MNTTAQFIKNPTIGGDACTLHSYSTYTFPEFEKHLNAFITKDINLLSISMNQLQFLNRLQDEGIVQDILNGDNKQKWFDIIKDYEHYMYMASINIKDIQITLEMELIWRTHLLNPVKYHTDCLKLFHHVIDHNIDANIHTMPRHSPIQKQCGYNCNLLDGRYHEFYDAIVRQLKSLQKLSDHLSNPGQKDIQRFKQFLYLLYLKNTSHGIDFLIIPTLDMDLIWHSYQLCPIHYQKLSHCVLRDTTSIIHHEDKISDARLGEYGEKTQTLWNKTFHQRKWMKNTLRILVSIIALGLVFAAIYPHDYYSDNPYQIRQYTNDITLNLSANNIHFNTIIYYHFNSKFHVNSRGFKSIANVVDNRPSSVTNIKYHPTSTVYDYSFLTKDGWYDIMYDFSHHWWNTNVQTHFVHFEYDLSFDYLCKFRQNQKKFALSLPWINKWRYPQRVTGIAINIYCDQSVFKATQFNSTWFDIDQTSFVAENANATGYRLCYQLTPKYIPNIDLIVYGNDSNVFNGSHMVRAVCSTLPITPNKKESEEGLSGGATAGIIIGSIMALVILDRGMVKWCGVSLICDILLSDSGSDRSYRSTCGGGGGGGGGACGG